MKKESFDILLIEYDILFQDWKRVREEGSIRMQLLINVTVFVLSGLGLLFQFGNKDLQSISLFFIAGFGLLSIIAGQTLIFMINRNISSDQYLRAMSRVRKCFIENDTELAKYFTWQGSDIPTSFLDFSNLGLINQTLVLLSVFISCFLATLAILYFQDLNISIIIFLFVLPIAYFSFYSLIRNQLKKSKEKAINEIRFD